FLGHGVPNAERIEHAARGGRDCGSPDISSCLANRRICQCDGKIRAKCLAERDGERKPGKSAACDQNVRAIVCECWQVRWPFSKGNHWPIDFDLVPSVTAASGLRTYLDLLGRSMTSAVKDLLDILDLEPIEVNLFRGRSPQVGWQRVFGGQVIGQALVAACRTVDGVVDRPPHSLHGYFLLAGDPKVPIIYEVDRIRDGRSFTTRRVVAIQHGQAIFSMSVSFHGNEPGLDHQVEMPNVPSPDELPSDLEIRQRVLPMMPDPIRRYFERERPIELRPVEFERYLGKKFPDGRFNIWIRT